MIITSVKSKLNFNNLLLEIIVSFEDQRKKLLVLVSVLLFWLSLIVTYS